MQLADRVKAEAGRAKEEIGTEQRQNSNAIIQLKAALGKDE
jgi:hypothetical protein